MMRLSPRHFLARPSQVLRAPSKFVLCVFVICMSILLSLGAIGANKAQASQSPAAVVAASYQAIDTAMNAGAVVQHIQAATLNPATLLSPAQAHVDDSAAGAFLYHYDLARIQSLRS